MGHSMYLELFETGKLRTIADNLYNSLSECRICPRKCGVNRIKGELGFCRTPKDAIISSTGPHFGEEPPLVGRYGSGTIFFAGCNLHCIFCQNSGISWEMEGKSVSIDELAEMMLNIQKLGCHNLNFVTPSHVVPQILLALNEACKEGFKLPLVYNSGGYDSVETLQLIEEVFDIYMPDMKYADNNIAKELSDAPDYPETMYNALKEMHKQVGNLKINSDGIAEKGLLIRHLVLPNNLAGTERIIKFIAEELSTDSYVNVMAQYRPCYKARKYPEISRRLNMDEYNEACEIARSNGLYRGY